MWPFKKKEEVRPVVIIKDCSMYCTDGYLPNEEKRCCRWVILRRTYIVEDKPVVKDEGRCAIAWIPDMLIELRQVLSEKKE